MIINQLPEWVPLTNFVLSAIALALMIGIAIRRVAKLPETPTSSGRWLVVDTAAIVGCIILAAGALFQLGWISLGDWVLFGTWGRSALVVVLFVLLAWKD